MTHGEILRVTDHATEETTIEVNVLRYSDDPEVTSYPEPVTIPTRPLFSPDVDPIFPVLYTVQDLFVAPAFVSKPTATLVAVAMSGTVDKAKGEGEDGEVIVTPASWEGSTTYEIGTPAAADPFDQLRGGGRRKTDLGRKILNVTEMGTRVAVEIAKQVAAGYQATGELFLENAQNMEALAHALREDPAGVAKAILKDVPNLPANIVKDLGKALEQMGSSNAVERNKGTMAVTATLYGFLRRRVPNRTALGISDHLDDFAFRHKAQTWKQFANTNPLEWKSAFMKVMNDADQHILFNLKGVDVWGGVGRASRNLGGATDWELFQIMQHKEWWPRITWMNGNTVVGNPFE